MSGSRRKKDPGNVPLRAVAPRTHSFGEQTIPEQLRREVEERVVRYDPAQGDIDLSCCGIEARHMNWVARRLSLLLDLTALDIGINNIGDAGARVLAKYLPHLRTLDIGSNNIGDAGARVLAKNLPHLRTLNIGSNNIGDAGARVLAKNLPHLRTLDISSNYIGDPGAEALAENLPHLMTLNIGMNNIGDPGAEALVENLPQLTTLEICTNSICEAGVLAVAKNLRHVQLLDIRSNSIRDAKIIVDLLIRLLPVGSRGKPGGELRSIGVRGNPLRWSNTGSFVSEETLLETNAERLLTLLLASRPGKGEAFWAARATLAGLGMSGKTRLARHLVDHPSRWEHTELHDRTVGIDPLQTTIEAEVDGTLQEISLTVLDCGGQREQLQSHHNLVYRASGRSLFILCLHAGKDFRSRDGNRADYYLRMLQSYRKDANLPVLIVVTYGELAGAGPCQRQTGGDDRRQSRGDPLG
jgi:hypothetical protein